MRGRRRPGVPGPPAVAEADVSDLVLDGLVAHRGRPLFTPVHARVAPGTLLGLVGPNGAGKSSLLSAIVGRGVTTSGHARYGDTNLHTLRPRRLAAVLSYMTQDSYAPNELRVRDVVAVGARASGRGGTEARAMAALERLGRAEEHTAELQPRGPLGCRHQR